MTTFSRRPVTAAVLLALAAATGGPGGCGGSSSAPTISNLRITPASAMQCDGACETWVTGWVDFEDRGGDLATFHLVPGVGPETRAPITSAAGMGSGTLRGDFLVSTAGIGAFTFRVYVSDAGGNASNELTGRFEVKVNDVGTHWTPRSLPAGAASATALRGVAWTGSLFVAVGAGVLTSPDGVSWTERSAGTGLDLRAVAWTGTQAVAVGKGGQVFASSDGIAWNARAIPPAHEPLLTGVAAAPGRIVAVGTQWDAVLLQPAPLLITSTDGITWTAGLVPSDVLLTSVAWSGTRFVAVGSGGVASYMQPTTLTSDDGIAWTRHLIGSVPVPSGGGSFQEVGWGGGTFVAGASGSLALSTDGVVWVDTHGPASGAIGWSGSHFLDCGNYTCYSSSDGTTWIQRAHSSNPPLKMNAVAWGVDRWVTVGADMLSGSAAALTSP